MKALVCGWFSFEQMGATAGDLLARDSVCAWLRSSGLDFTVAVAPPFEDGVDWRMLDAADYPLVVFVCGPFGNGPPITEFLAHFSESRLFGVNLSMLQKLDEWNPFDLLLERDSSRTCRPDVVFLSDRTHVPSVGVVLVHPQSEYGKRGAHARANEALTRLLSDREAARVEIDTRLDANATGLRSAGEIESLISRMDVVVTTRLHGLVLAVKNCVPVLAVDPIEGGAKIYRQAQTIGWPIVFLPEQLTVKGLNDAFDICLSAEGREKAHECRDKALNGAGEIKKDFEAAVRDIL